MVGRSYTHTSAQCSPASVGLAQARPNNSVGSYIRFTDASSLVHLVHRCTGSPGALVHWFTWGWCTGSPGLPGAPRAC